MKKILFALIATVTLVSCGDKFTEEIIEIQGAYYNELRIENPSVNVKAGEEIIIGELVFDMQGFRQREIEVEMDFEEDYVNLFIESITLRKQEAENDIYLMNVYNDDRDDYEVTYGPLTQDQIIQGLDTYEIVFTPKESFPFVYSARIWISVSIYGLVDNQSIRLNGGDIKGNLNALNFIP